MARAIWKGSLAFGLVNIPVELFSAVRDHRPKFRLLHAKDESPVHYERVCQTEGKPVAWEDLVKGYEYAKGQFVVLTKDDFKTAAVEKTKTIDILDFVDPDQIDERYFETLGLTILDGRGFRATDAAGTPIVAVVNEQVARHYWPGQDPLGKRFRLDGANGPWAQVVGVVKTSKYLFIMEPPREFVYLAFRQRPVRQAYLIAESAGDPAALAAPLREMVRRLDAGQPIFNVRTMEAFYDLRITSQLMMIAGLIIAMGTMALALSVVGLYGLVAHAVGRRTREIGIRMAIGAGRFEVLRMVLRQGMALAVAGLGIGLLASVGVSQLLGAVFPDGGPGGDGRIDLLAFPIVAAAVLAVTFVASYVPARRASRVNPTEALRHE